MNRSTLNPNTLSNLLDPNQIGRSSPRSSNALDPNQIGVTKPGVSSSPRSSNVGMLPDSGAAQQRKNFSRAPGNSQRKFQSQIDDYKPHITTLTIGGFGDDLVPATRQFHGHAIHHSLLAGGRLTSTGVHRNTLVGQGVGGQRATTQGVAGQRATTQGFAGQRNTTVPRFLFGSEDVDDFAHDDAMQKDTSAAPSPKWVPPPSISTITRNADLLEEEHLRVILGDIDSELMLRIRKAADAISSLFKEADADKDGLVSHFETKAAFRKISHNLADDVDKYLPEEFHGFDGKIDRDRFLVAFIPLALSVPQEVIIARLPEERRKSAKPDTQATRRTLLNALPSLSDAKRMSTPRKSFVGSAGLRLGSTVQHREKFGEEPPEAISATPHLMQGVQDMGRRRSEKKRLTMESKEEKVLATTTHCRRSIIDVIKFDERTDSLVHQA